ncbi:PREDICTED: serine/threonine-protein kinase UCNL-like [Populus euphratica]|uniref:non-specific serine/threonine protein kinase n=1 Tax=Populus euphratica TaxID=75702 RepID=A0AAJ6XET7_POPEU|nr:PREDICTED: serine/threonine-protein kinase UCNL-like [Populus euphratica]
MELPPPFPRPPPPPPPQDQQHQKDLDFHSIRATKVLGKGAMGTVFLVHNQETDSTAKNRFALKVVDKSTLHTKFDAERRARWEIQVLNQLSTPKTTHPFLPHLISSIETQEFLAWSVPFCPGGDLNVLRHRQNDHVFSPAVIRFYVAEIVCALDHLHQMGIVYRDLKPENILIQHSGHVTLTDFDLSRTLTRKTVRNLVPNAAASCNNLITVGEIEQKPQKKEQHHIRNLTRWWFVNDVPHKKNGLKKAKSARVSPVSRRKPSFNNGERSNSFVGTEEYVSPEVVRGDGHEFAVDWWALGILSFEMLYGTTPFVGKNRKETFRNVLTKKPEFIGKRNELTDLIERLLEKDPTQRLGYQRGACEIKEHVFFKGVRWDLLTEVLRPPFIPSRDDGELTERATAAGVDIREYFKDLRAPPPSMPPSPCSDYYMKLSEF